MGSPLPAGRLLLLLLLSTDLSASAGVRCPPPARRLLCVPSWTGLQDRSASGPQHSHFRLLLPKPPKPQKFLSGRRHELPAPAQRTGRALSRTSPGLSPNCLRAKRTQPTEHGAPGLVAGPLRSRGPAFSFELLPEARAIRVTVPPGPEVSVRLCHQWALECEELSRPFHAQKVVSGGRAVELPYEFLLPCLCVEASFLQEDTVRRKKCPFQSWPGAYGPDFWASMDFTDHSQHTQMVLSSAPRCPLQLQASLCQRREQGAPCQDLPNATAHESDGWYVLEKVDLHPHLCFKFSFRNTSHVECPHRPAPSWSVSLETRARRLVLRFLSRVPATFSATGLPRDSLALPVYSVTQTRSSPVPLDLVIPFPVPGGCVLVWRSDVQFSWKHVLCPEVAHRHGGLLILALLAFVVLLGLLSVLSRRRSFSGPGGARPVLLLHAADSEAQRRLVAALAELLRAALGGARDVIVDVWDARRVARLGPLPWLWAARARVRRERGAVLLLCSRRRAPRAALCAPPRPAPLLAYFGRLGAPRRLPAPLRALPRFRLLRDLPRLLRALGAGPAARRPPRAPLQRCRRLEREAARGAARGTC